MNSKQKIPSSAPLHPLIPSSYRGGGIERRSLGPLETIRIGEEFGRSLRAGMVVALRGELGAGKTHFVKGIAGSLGIDERELTSPTFALVNEYAATLGDRPFTLFHLDCYRFT